MNHRVYFNVLLKCWCPICLLWYHIIVWTLCTIVLWELPIVLKIAPRGKLSQKNEAGSHSWGRLSCPKVVTTCPKVVTYGDNLPLVLWQPSPGWGWLSHLFFLALMLNCDIKFGCIHQLLLLILSIHIYLTFDILGLELLYTAKITQAHLSKLWLYAPRSPTTKVVSLMKWVKIFIFWTCS